MKILLVKLKEPNSNSFMPPYGLWSLRATIKKFNRFCRVDICDEHIGDKIEDFVDRNYELVGISAQFSIQNEEFLRVAKLCHDNGHIVIAGGVHASNVKRPDFVDQIVVGEGEHYFANLFGKEFKDFDDIPHPIFKKKEIKKYWEKASPHGTETKTKRWVTIETSRGCNMKCGFCGMPKYWHGWKGRSVKWIEKYLKYLKRKGIKELLVEDDNVSLNRERFIEIIRLFKKYGMCWSTPNGILINTLNERVIEELKVSTLWRINLPFETCLKRVAELMNLGTKYIPYERGLELINRLKGFGFKVIGFFIIGYPGETVKEIKEDLKLANSMPLDGRHIHIATPYPGTVLYEFCKEHNYLDIKDDDDFYKKLLYTSSLIKTEEFNPEIINNIRKEDREEAIRRREQNK